MDSSRAADGWSPLRPGSAVTRWAMSAAEERLYPGLARPMPDRVNYRFVNGWVDTGDLPCREALRAELPVREVACPEGPFVDVYPGLDGPDVDFSRFCHRPTLIRRGFRCLLRVEAAGTARLRLSTCGGVHVWLGAERIARFEPYHRNVPETVEVAVPLRPGEAPLTVLLEDLHERDTTCFFSLVWLEGPPVAVRLPGGHDATEAERVGRVLAGLRTDGVFREAGAVRLVAEPPPEAPVHLTVSGIAPFMRGGLSRDPEERRSVEVVLTPGAPSAPVFDVGEAAAGCLALEVTATAGGARLSRLLGITTLPPAEPLPDDPTARRARAAELIAERGGFEPSVAALRALRGERPEQVARVLRAALVTIEERQDCSDFTILPLLRLWRDGRDTLEPDLRDRLRRAILGYRYWLDEPGDDVMWFWSENHVLCFHAAQLVAGGLFPDEIFANSGMSGAVLAAEARRRLGLWFDSIEAHGLCEWNSAAYYPIDLLGLFTLHDMAPELRERAAAAMDRLFVMTALHISGGVPAGSQGRCYEKELLAGPATELGTVAALAFGGGYRPGYDRASALFCLSDYAPPAAAAACAVPARGDWLEARYTQGLGHAGRLSLWKSAAGQLSTVSGLNAGGRGHQAQVLDVQMAGHPMARLWVNHPGELKVWGERRPSLLAGSHVMPQVAQHGPTGLMIFDIDRPWTEIGFTQLFAAPGAFEGPERVDGWLVFACGEGRVGAWCSVPLEEVGGLYAGALRRAQGSRTAWVVTLAVPGEDAGAFATRLGRMAPVFDAEALRLRVAGHDGAALVLDFDGAYSVGGAAQAFAPLDPVPHLGWNGGPLRPWEERDAGS